MWSHLAGVLLLLCAADAAPADSKTVPDFGKMYHVKGVLSLPYSKITEDFVACFDLEGNRSRIDYRNGTVRTFQIGKDLDYGAIYVIKPVLRVTKYFQVKGTKEDPIRPQSVIPDLKSFEFEKTEDLNGVECEVWKSVVQVGHKKNTYRLWVTRPEGEDSPATPQRFQMQGFNTLLEAHNDNYTIDYRDFSTQTEPEVFTPPEGVTWDELPDPEKFEMSANPIEDYVSLSPVSHGQLFDDFKKKFNRQYEGDKEHEERENLFLHSLRYVHSTNRQGLTFTVGTNHFSDRTKAEMARMTGGLLPRRPKDDA